MTSPLELDGRDDKDLLTLYRTWPAADLAYLRHAFKLDEAQARQEGRMTTVAFCQGRLALIDQVFREWEASDQP
jgi:hypothetical protein